MSFHFSNRSSALAKKHLTQDLLAQLKHLKTRTGFTLEMAIASGIKNPDSQIGIYAGDAQSYEIFSPVFDPIIFEYHDTRQKQAPPRQIPAMDLPDPDPDQQYILSTRIRVARNLAGFSFPCHIDLAGRRQVEARILAAMDLLPDHLSGTCYSLETLTKADRSWLERKKLLFQKGDRFQAAAGINTDFPKCRNIFCASDQTFAAWINEEDHLRVFCMEKSSRMDRVFNRLVQGLTALNQHLDFAWSPAYGHLNSCPTNIGTGMRASVHIRLEHLCQHHHILSCIAQQHHLQIRGTQGEKTGIENNVLDISNRYRFGLCEKEILKTLHKGVSALIAAEKMIQLIPLKKGAKQ